MTRELPLTKGKVALVDDADYEWLTAWSWHFDHGYASRHTNSKGKFYLHREIMAAQTGYEVDHINGNRLDNRRCNLRMATRQENARNVAKTQTATSSRFKGVTWDRSRQRWAAYIVIYYKRLGLGRFVNEQDAARRYDSAARHHFGRFAQLNFPEEDNANG